MSEALVLTLPTQFVISWAELALFAGVYMGLGAGLFAGMIYANPGELDESPVELAFLLIAAAFIGLPIIVAVALVEG